MGADQDKIFKILAYQGRRKAGTASSRAEAVLLARSQGYGLFNHLFEQELPVLASPWEIPSLPQVELERKFVLATA